MSDWLPGRASSFVEGFQEDFRTEPPSSFLISLLIVEEAIEESDSSRRTFETS